MPQLLAAIVTAALFVTFADTLTAQTSGSSPILTLDQDRLFRSSDFGRRVQVEIEERSQALSLENRELESQLLKEERRLTDDRDTMSPEEFKTLAENFDARVVSVRDKQNLKRDELRSYGENERQRFFEAAIPVLFRLVEESGALAILNDSAVIFSIRQIDITDRAIASVNRELGDGFNVVEKQLSNEQSETNVSD